MASTNRLFRNSIATMTQERLVFHISRYAERDELITFLNNIDQLRKACVLEDEMTATLSEAQVQLQKSNNITCQPESIHEIKLKTLEGRILLLMLLSSLDKSSNEVKKMFEIDQRINRLIMEYRMYGGTREFIDPDFLV